MSARAQLFLFNSVGGWHGIRAGSPLNYPTSILVRSTSFGGELSDNRPREVSWPSAIYSDSKSVARICLDAGVFIYSSVGEGNLTRPVQRQKQSSVEVAERQIICSAWLGFFKHLIQRILWTNPRRVNQPVEDGSDPRQSRPDQRAIFYGRVVLSSDGEGSEAAPG